MEIKAHAQRTSVETKESIKAIGRWTNEKKRKEGENGTSKVIPRMVSSGMPTQNGESRRDFLDDNSTKNNFGKLKTRNN